MRRSRRSCGDVRIAWGRVFVRKAGSMLTVAMREQADPPAHFRETVCAHEGTDSE